MAGGSGQRFWPLSRQHRPKQILNLAGPDTSMLKQAVDRVLPLAGRDHVYIITGKALQRPIQQADLGLPNGNTIAEPCKRNTAGCLIYAAATILARHDLPPERIAMAVLPADQQIGKLAAFHAAFNTALQTAEAGEALVTIGIRPSRPETGYGYIELAKPPAERDSANPGCTPQPAIGFTEKPAPETAAAFLSSGRFLWNSGMFFWRLDTFLDELNSTGPELARILDQLAEAIRRGDAQRANDVFAELPNISIDYALMERARNVAVVPAAFSWDDVGAWDALDRTYPRDAHGNVAVGAPLLIDSENCIVYNEPGPEHTAVAVVGMRDVVVVATEDGVLVVPKAKAQDVRDVVEQLQNRGATQV